MPTIARFYGIVVFMNYREHGPPHFHARYQDYEIAVEIASGFGLWQDAAPCIADDFGLGRHESTGAA